MYLFLLRWALIADSSFPPIDASFWMSIRFLRVLFCILSDCPLRLTLISAAMSSHAYPAAFASSSYCFWRKRLPFCLYSRSASSYKPKSILKSTYLVVSASLRNLHPVVCLLPLSNLTSDLIKLRFVFLNSRSYHVTLKSIWDVHWFNFHLFKIVLGLFVFVWILVGDHFCFWRVIKHRLKLRNTLWIILFIAPEKVLRHYITIK